MAEKFIRERVRFRVGEERILVIQGWIDKEAPEQKNIRKDSSTTAENCQKDKDPQDWFAASLDGQLLPMDVVTQRGPEVTRKYLRYRTNVAEEYFLMIHLPEHYPKARSLSVNFKGRGICRLSGMRLARLSGHLNSWVETLQELPDGKLRLRGWYLSASKVKLDLCGGNGRKLDCSFSRIPRMDILNEFPDAAPEEAVGFEVTFSRPEENSVRLILDGAEGKARYPVNIRKMLAGKEGISVIIRKSWKYFQRKGVRQFIQRVQEELLGTSRISYDRWRRKYGTAQKELERQRADHLAWEPCFSILVPLYRTPENYLRQMIASVKAQTYANWELILSDGSGPDSPLNKVLEQFSSGDARIRVIQNNRQLRIAPNTNTAMAAAKGDFLVFGDHDDLFAPDALYECAALLNRKPDAMLIYTDEDKVDEKGKTYFEPHFKSDYNPELLCSMNYFCHMVAVRRSLARQAGFLDPAFDGAQDYDYVLRCTEQTEASQILHIPKILYHWRAHRDSTAENPESKRYAFEAGARAVQAHYDRLGIRAKVMEGQYPGLYRTEFEILGNPMISILIPNKDHREDLETCVRSILTKSDYTNFEIVIIENNSTDPETFAYYRKLEAEDPRIRIVDYGKGDGTFNYSAINNFGAANAHGDYLLLLNNDTELLRPDVLRQMLGFCQQKEIGIAGARLYYEDGTIQHAGVVLGFGGIAGHAFIGEPGSANGYFSRILCAQDYSAVTAACLMVKASVFREVGGLTEELKVAFNDIDFCMKVRALGLRVVYQPEAELRHYESKSRGLETTQDKIERFNHEMALFLDRWGSQVEAGDPYYNPNLTLDKADFSLRT